MRCQCCNCNLSDKESTQKHPETLEYLDTCNKCLKEIGIFPVESSTKEHYYDDEEDVYSDDYMESCINYDKEYYDEKE